jgi:putative transposase
MTTYTQIIYQIVYSTRGNTDTLTAPNRPELFKYMWGIIKEKKCHPYMINGVENHLHIVTHLHPSVALADLVKDLKMASSYFINQKSLFKNFNGWQEGYGAFTYSIREKEKIINYVKNQEEHHKKQSYKEEYKDLLQEHGIDFDERYFI